MTFISFSNFGNIVKIGRICDIMSITVTLVRLDEDMTGLRNIWFGEVKELTFVALVLMLRLDKEMTEFRKISLYTQARKYRTGKQKFGGFC